MPCRVGVIIIDYMISSNHNCHFQMQCNRLHCKCNHNQQLLSRLHKICHVISCQRYDLVCKEKVNNRTDLPIDGLLSYLYTWWFVTLFDLWTWKENVLKHRFRSCPYYKSYKHAFQMNWCCFHMVKLKLVTQPAIVHGFFVTPLF